jgi:gas vesicle protein
MSNLKLVIGIVIGAIMGMIAGMLIAPSSGEKTRKKLKKGFDDRVDEYSKTGSEAVKNLKESVRKV